MSAHFSQIGRKKRPRRGREGAFETIPLSELLQYFFHAEVFAYIETFYYYYYQERIFLICVCSLCSLFFLKYVLRQFKCSVQYRPKALKRSVFVSGVAGKDFIEVESLKIERKGC